MNFWTDKKSAVAAIAVSVLVFFNTALFFDEAQASNCFSTESGNENKIIPGGTCSGALTIPSNIEVIGSGAFAGPTIESVSFAPNSSLTTIGSAAFGSNTKLTSVDLSQATNLTTIGDAAFTGASSLTSFDFGNPAGLTALSAGILQNSGLSEITIPSSITSIGGQAFSGSSELETITFLGNAPTFLPDSFSGLKADAVAVVSDSATGFDSAFETASGLTVRVQSSTPAAPVPYSGPLITGISESAGSHQLSPEETFTVEGNRLGTVSKALIGDQELEILSVTNNLLELRAPKNLEPGEYDLIIQSSIGNLTYLDAFVVDEESIAADSYGEMSAWTKKINDTQAKVYVKFPTVGEKVRISHQTGGSGEYNTVYVKTTSSETMDGLRVVEGIGTYIVRTINLADINRIRVTVGDQTPVQVRYNR